MSWRDHAACHGIDIDVFYRHENARNVETVNDLAARAMALCSGCSVRTDCLEAALTEDRAQHGIRGGTYARTRTLIALNRRDQEEDTA